VGIGRDYYNQRAMKTLATLLFVLFTASVFADDIAPPKLDADVARAMQTFRVPGVSIAIVKDGELVVAKGWGVRKLGDAAKVDGDTLFQIASNSKAFTTASLAMLVDEGKLSWDDPVSKYLPSFRMYDPYASNEVMIRDLASHRAGLGLGAGDLMIYPPTDLTREEIVNRIRYIKPASSMRSRYAYNNLMFIAAGRVLETISGKSWEQFVTERILTPLAMTKTVTSVTALRASANAAIAHAPENDRMIPVRYDVWENAGPAGGIASSANDMAKWLIAQLARGKYDGEKRLFSEKQSREMWSAQTVLRIAAPQGPLAPLAPHFSEYALGWNMRDFRGHQVIGHGGGLTGMISRVTLIPDLNLGIVVLTNAAPSSLASAMSWQIADHYIGGATNDWIDLYRQNDVADAKRYAEEQKKHEDARAKDSKPSLPLEKYAGRYTDPWYGDVNLAVENGKLMMRFSHSPELTGELEHWQHDVFVARWRDRFLDADAFVTFTLNADGEVDSIAMKPVSSRTDFSFDFQDLNLRRRN
jgi:CubicO group peptidase (beta-lactamase class C family)